MNKATQFEDKMRKESLPQAAIDTFLNYYHQLVTGKTGLIADSEIDPVTEKDIGDYDKIQEYKSLGKEVLPKTVVIKLNGGLGTTMGLQSTKSLIPVKGDLTFLDITALQVRFLDKLTQSKIPLVLMDSFKTHQESAEVLKKYLDLYCGIPFSFVQHKFPRIDAKTLEPAKSSSDPVLEWNPPGHGDIYTALVTSGILDKLLGHGYQYAFVSNIDNLGATLDFSILGYFAKNDYSFLMEVTDRTDMDRKGGHLAKTKNSRLILRESAQCPEQDAKSFGDTDKYRYFNTNNLWINLAKLKYQLDKKHNLIDLPMIRNKKRLDPIDPDSPLVYQLESAMGSAISAFEPSQALRVPRDRFAPVKNCEELLLLWSDYYQLTEDYRVIQDTSKSGDSINITLDPKYYGRLDQLKERFPYGAPSLLNCKYLSIIGDIKFGKNISISGNVTISNITEVIKTIDDNSEIKSDMIFS